jgi:hypothetical protein
MSFKKFDLIRDFAADVYLSEAQNPIFPLPSYTLYREGGVELNQREGERDKKQIIFFLTIFLSWEEVSSFHVNQYNNAVFRSIVFVIALRATSTSTYILYRSILMLCILHLSFLRQYYATNLLFFGRKQATCAYCVTTWQQFTADLLYN